MFSRILSLLLICSFIPAMSVFAEKSTGEDPTRVQYYADYQKSAESYCNAKDRPWAKAQNMIPIPEYANIDYFSGSTDDVNQKIDSLKNMKTLSKEDRKQLEEELDSDRIEHLSKFRIVEVARLQYRSAMNMVFACAIIEDRLKVVSDFYKASMEAFPNKNSESKKELQREEKKLKKARELHHCNSKNVIDTVAIMREMVNSSTKQYCHYNYYLDYIKTHVQHNYGNIHNVEASVGKKGRKAESSIGSDDWQYIQRDYQDAITRESHRAKIGITRALRTYQEMQRTYQIHILLRMIYADYLELRRAFSVYMNASSQTYMKAYNAQDANRR